MILNPTFGCVASALLALATLTTTTDSQSATSSAPSVAPRASTPQSAPASLLLVYGGRGHQVTLAAASRLPLAFRDHQTSASTHRVRLLDRAGNTLEAIGCHIPSPHDPVGRCHGLCCGQEDPQPRESISATQPAPTSVCVPDLVATERIVLEVLGEGSWRLLHSKSRRNLNETNQQVVYTGLDTSAYAKSRGELR